MAKYLNKTECSEDRSEGRFIRDENGTQKDKILPQYLAGIAANLTAVITGTVIAWTSPSLPILEGPDSPIPITEVQNSWISSLMPLAAAFGPFAAGYLADKFGRKKALLLSAVPALISWIILATGRSVELIYAARFIAGFIVGWIFAILPMYCGEIANEGIIVELQNPKLVYADYVQECLGTMTKKTVGNLLEFEDDLPLSKDRHHHKKCQKSVRGGIGSLMQIFIVIGLLFDYCLGPFIPYAWLSIAAAFIPIIFVFIFVWMPESPYYLLMKEDKGSAEKALQWLRGKSAGDVFNELLEIQAHCEKAKSETGTFKDLFATRGTRKALVISLGLVGLQQLSGINVVLFNAQTIFEKSGGSIKPAISVIITGFIMLAASAIIPFLVDKFGRKILLLISAMAMAVAQGILGLCFFLEKKGTDMTNFHFLSLFAVVFYIVVYCLGFGPLPWAVMGEMFPSNIKTLASTITASFCWILTFLLTRFFNDIVRMLGGNDYSFWLFSIFCLIAAVFVHFLIIETKEKTLAEIQDLLNRS